MELRFIGTSHISPESIRQIRQAIDSFQPTIVCVELDRARLSGLLKKQRQTYSPRLILQLGLGGYLFALVASFVQRKLGNFVGTTPGEDMLTAVQCAREKKISVALIDQPIDLTMRRVSGEFGMRTIWGFVCDFFSSVFFPNKTRAKLGLDGFNLAAAPSEKFVLQALAHLESRYPGLYRALLVERNTYMTSRIAKLGELNPEGRLLVVVGAAHIPGMRDELRNNYKLSSEKQLV